MAESRYDVCIIGAGPGGLAALSAVLEPFSHDQLSAKQATRAAIALGTQRPSKPKVCVIDPMPWLSTWTSRFNELEIQWLRSPAVAHPDMFDMFSLYSFAASRGRLNELLDTGAGDSKEVRASQTSHRGASETWRLPSNALFQDFCLDLIEALSHDFHCARAEDVREKSGGYTIVLDSGIEIEADSVVLALGVPGVPVIPAVLAGLPRHVAFHTDFDGGAGLAALASRERVLVIGGGLSAVQTAQLAHRRGCEVLLVSRRPLTTRHFDIDVKWFDWRRTQQCLFDFLSLSEEERLAMIRRTRGGGSVPKIYMTDLRSRAAQGGLTLLVGEVQVVGQQDGGALHVQIGGRIHNVDKIVAACGHRPDCTSLPLIANVQRRFPALIHGGLPAVSKDLEWIGSHKLFVIGALAALQVGPDAGNLMGLRRAAQLVASALDSRRWLRDETAVRTNIRGNQFAALFDDDGDSDSDEIVSECRETECCKVRSCSQSTAASLRLSSASEDE